MYLTSSRLILTKWGTGIPHTTSWVTQVGTTSYG